MTHLCHSLGICPKPSEPTHHRDACVSTTIAALVTIAESQRSSLNIYVQKMTTNIGSVCTVATYASAEKMNL